MKRGLCEARPVLRRMFKGLLIIRILYTEVMAKTVAEHKHLIMVSTIYRHMGDCHSVADSYDAPACIAIVMCQAAGEL